MGTCCRVCILSMGLSGELICVRRYRAFSQIPHKAEDTAVILLLISKAFDIMIF